MTATAEPPPPASLSARIPLRLERRLSPQRRWQAALVPFGSLLLAFAIVGVLLALVGNNPFSALSQVVRAAYSFVTQGLGSAILVGRDGVFGPGTACPRSTPPAGCRARSRR